MSIIISVLLLLIIIGILAVRSTKLEKHEPDYYTFYIIGLVWLPIGLASQNASLWILGLVFLAIGIANKDK